MSQKTIKGTGLKAAKASVKETIRNCTVGGFVFSKNDGMTLFTHDSFKISGSL